MRGESLKKYSGRVLKYLADEYGLSGLKIESGGKHPAIPLTYNGKRHTITLRHDGGFKGFDLKRQDIRRTLGPPLSQGETAMAMIEESRDAISALASSESDSGSFIVSPPSIAVAMAPEHRSGTCRGVAVVNTSNHCLSLRFPFEFSPFLIGERLGIEKFGEGWRIFKSDKNRGRLRRESNRAIASVTAAYVGLSLTNPMPLTNVEFVIGDDQMLAKPLSDISKYQLPFPIAREAEKPPEVSPMELPKEGWKPNPAPAALPPVAGWPEARIREVLEMVRRIEIETPYHIARDASDGSLCFRAKIIK